MSKPAAEAALARIAAAGGALIDAPAVLPAQMVVELSGEDLRSRLCIFPTDAGEEFCLRPDLTTAIASQVATAQIPATRYHAMGRVFRQPLFGSGEALEHLQVGFEWFGGNAGQEDAEALAVALEAAKAGGAISGDVRFGDVAIYRAVVRALGFSRTWVGRLERAFTRGSGPKAVLAGGPREVSALAASVATAGPREAVKVVESILGAANLPMVGGRTAEEIAERLVEKASEGSPPARAAELLGQYLDLRAPAKDCVATLEAFAKEAGIDITQALTRFRDRLKLVEAMKPPFWSGSVFSAEAGRRFDYYDGFVFDLAREPGRPIVSGGRYDGLVGKLSNGNLQAPAIGAALRADRLAEGRA